MSNILTLPDNEDTDLLDSVAQEFRLGYAELADNAERELSGKNFIFSRYGKELYPYFEDADATVVPGCIIPLKEGRPVASVDSTCVLLGESSGGALYAARMSVGISFRGALRKFARLGPLLVYVSESGVSGIKVRPSRAELGLLMSDHSIAERMIRNSIERKAVQSLLQSESKLIVMTDGSLKHPYTQMSELALSRENGSSLVGFSKSSSLILSEGVVSSINKADGAAFHVIDDGAVKTALAKFSKDGLVFRLDFAEGGETLKDTLGLMLFNDAFSSGYPESLKVAHHLSIFSKADDQALKAFVTRRFRLKRLPTFALRTIALGSFRGGS